MEPLGHPSFIDVGGTTLHWIERGQGRPLVLLHGLSDSHRTWRRIGERMSAGRRVLMLDLPGHGLSGRPDATYALDWHASVVAAWLDALGLEDVELVGHSFGGGVAQQLLLHRADRIRRLGLVAAGGLGREVPVGLRLMSLPVLESIAQPFMHLGTRIALAGPLGKQFGPEERDWLAWVNGAPGTGRALARSVRGVIGPLGQTRNFLEHAFEVRRLPPMALYWGMRDPVIPVRHGVRAASLLNHVRLVRFEGCGHFPHLEQPRAFTDALLAFLDGDERCARVAIPLSLPRRRSWFRRALSWVGRLFGRLVTPPPRPGVANVG